MKKRRQSGLICPPKYENLISQLTVRHAKAAAAQTTLGRNKKQTKSMSTILIIAYDLKNVRPDDNRNVKKALIQKYTNTYTHLDAQNSLSIVPEWVRLRFPDTTIFVENATASAASVVAEVVDTIRSIGAEADSVFVAYIGENSLWNAEKKRI
jgi:hypothetical protein